MHTSWFRGALATLALAGCDPALCLDPDAVAQALGSAGQPIVGGSVDSTSRSTVALLLSYEDGGRGLCSGSLIARQGSRAYVLTAAHCVQDAVEHVYEAVDWRDCEAGGDASKCFASFTPVSWQAHPGYNDQTLENDFAIVVVEGASESTSVTPAATSDASIAVGQVLQLSGYGRTYAGPDDDDAAFNSVRHKVSVELDVKTSNWLSVDATTGMTACFGDSGGPAFAHVDGALVVAGVASNADANCAQVANYARVALVYEGFIAPLIDGDDPPSEGGSGQGGSGQGGSGQGGDPASSSSSSGAGGSAPAVPPDGGAASGGADAASDDGGSADGGDAEEVCIPLSLKCEAAVGPTPGSFAAMFGAMALIVASLGRRWRR